MWTDGRVSENNATGGPNSSAETELSWSVGAVYGNIKLQLSYINN